MDIDITVQMLNDRIGFQFESIVDSVTGEDVLQKALDEQTSIQRSDTQVEIGFNIGSIYQSNITDDTIKHYLDNSYSFILPNHNGTIQKGETGYLKVVHDDTYVSKLKEYQEKNKYASSPRYTYPNHTLIGSFETKQNTRDDLGITQNTDSIETLQQKVSELEHNMSVLQHIITNLI